MHTVPVPPILDSWYVAIVLAIYVRRDVEQHFVQVMRVINPFCMRKAL